MRHRALRLLLEVGAVRETQNLSDEEISTGLMDLFRRDGCRVAFDLLVHWTRPQLLARVRRRCRFLGVAVEPEELLQDAYVNIFRYPHKFEASRPGAFIAWASTIVDNVVRRSLRRSPVLEIRSRPIEMLEQEPDDDFRQPSRLVIRAEAFLQASQTFSLFLLLYLEAYRGLNDRERRVLYRVEVEGMRYAELGAEIGVRPDALKMVVFRARRRILLKLQELVQPLPAAA